jgi:diguanylate cyclase (GGDEF)-like protein
MGAPMTAGKIYQSMMENAPFVFQLKDEDGRLVWCNHLCEERWHIQREEWIGKLDSERQPAEEARLARQRDKAVLASGNAVETREQELLADGKVRYWTTCHFTYRDDDGRRYLASLATEATRMAEDDMTLSSTRQALEQANSQLAQLVTTDELTGVSNRRAFEERLKHEFALALRHNLPLSLLLVDVDHFKVYNDEHGHTAGDAALRYLAQLLGGIVRTTDMVARYGGGEFAIILPYTPLESAMGLAARLARGVEADNGPAEGLTVSVGVTEKTPEMLNRERFMTMADEALNKAKHR